MENYDGYHVIQLYNHHKFNVLLFRKGIINQDYRSFFQYNYMEKDNNEDQYIYHKLDYRLHQDIIFYQQYHHNYEI